MHAVRLHTFGPAENLTYETTDDPVPGTGQVRTPSPRRACTSWTPPCARA